MSFLQLVLSLDKTKEEIILLWRICQFDRYPQMRDTAKRKKIFISSNEDNAKERKYSSPQIKTLQKERKYSSPQIKTLQKERKYSSPQIKTLQKERENIHLHN